MRTDVHPDIADHGNDARTGVSWPDHRDLLLRLADKDDCTAVAYALAGDRAMARIFWAYSHAERVAGGEG